MRRLFFILAIAGFAFSVAFARADEQLAHVRLRLAPCVDLPDGAVLHVTYEFSGLGDTPGLVRNAFDWKSGKGKTIDIDADLPAGFYQYEVVGSYDGHALRTPPPACNAPSYIGLLPGRTRTIAEKMPGGSVDLVPPLLLMGTLPSGYSASLVRYARKIDCGESMKGTPTRAIDEFETEDNAYYLRDRERETGDGQFGLTVVSPAGQTVTFGIEAGYPPSALNGPPAYARYDISTDLFQRALAHTPAGNAVCIGTPTTE